MMTNNGTESYPKSWFYFKVKGFPAGWKVKFNIQRMHMLYSLWSNKSPQCYKPCFRLNKEDWKRLDQDIFLNYIDNNIILTFQYVFEKEDNYEVSFAFSYPYSYEKNLNLVRDLTAQYSNDPDIYFHKEVITYSPELRLIHLLTISSHEGKTDQLEDYMSEALFPERVYESRPFKFKESKQYIMITARVHPGETPSSYALEGII